MNARPRTPTRDFRTLVPEPATACTSCPVCGSEECLVLEELGTYCTTMTAASLSKDREQPEGSARR